MVGLPGIILHGSATLAYAVRELVAREAGADPARVRRIACRFRGMVFPGTDIRLQLMERRWGAVKEGGMGVEGEELFFRVLNHEGKEAVSGGFIFLAN